ncbi:MAG: membrane protein insertase YidC [Candidatus Omnitrophica bacterium]|nr:membrane protein insertase YidC [Candidatus Omnitrophota bacterium]
MEAEKRVWIASLLSVVVLMAYSQILRKSTPPAVPSPTQPIENHIVQSSPLVKPLSELREEQVELESDQLRLSVGASTASIHSVALKAYAEKNTGIVLKFGRRVPVLAIAPEDDANWNLLEHAERTARWSRTLSSGVQQLIELQLDEHKPTFLVRIETANQSANPQHAPLAVHGAWERSDELSRQTNPLEAVLKVEKQRSWQRTYLRYHEGQSKVFDVPRGTRMLTLSERYFCLSMKPDESQLATAQINPAPQQVISAGLMTAVDLNPGDRVVQSISVYAGPRDFFHLREAGFDGAFQVGLLSKIGLILMMMLKGIAGIVKNYGVALILLSAIITFLLAPFTIISFKSMKKLQQLQPMMDTIKQKHQNDPQRANKEMLALFQEHKVSPLSGCLPMLLPLPIFFALWSAVNHFVGLRGAEFLWIRDLSLPDRLAKMPFGLDLNLLPILMCLAMFIQTKLSQQASQSAKSPFSGPLMSVVFLVMFYQVPSGLVLYWLTNSLVSIFWYRVAVS